jgi:hypothetical protein
LYVRAIQFASRPLEGGDSDEKVLVSGNLFDRARPAFFHGKRTG